MPPKILEAEIIQEAPPVTQGKNASSGVPTAEQLIKELTDLPGIFVGSVTETIRKHAAQGAPLAREKAREAGEKVVASFWDFVTSDRPVISREPPK